MRITIWLLYHRSCVGYQGREIKRERERDSAAIILARPRDHRSWKLINCIGSPDCLHLINSRYLSIMGIDFYSFLLYFSCGIYQAWTFFAPRSFTYSSWIVHLRSVKRTASTSGILWLYTSILYLDRWPEIFLATQTLPMEQTQFNRRWRINTLIPYSNIFDLIDEHFAIIVDFANNEYWYELDRHQAIFHFHFIDKETR